MNIDLRDNSWMQCGSSLLWDATALNLICPPDSVRSLREFLRLHQSDWPDADLKLIKGRTLVVSGLDAALDTLDADNAPAWLEKSVYPAILGFQEQVADGGREAALIFWLADSHRVFHQPAENTYHWHYRQKSIPIGRCIWNGAESSARRIIRSGADNRDTYVGLFLARIS